MGSLDKKVPPWILTLTVVAVFFLLLGSFEYQLRKKGFEFSPWKHYRTFGYNPEGDNIEFYEKDPQLFWRFRPSTTISSFWVPRASINRDGFRGADVVTPKPAGVYRIFCIGDSGTFGWNVNDDETLPANLETYLKAKHPSVQVINAGVPGYTSHQGLEILKRFAPSVQPNMVLFSFGYNDDNKLVYVTDRNRKKTAPIFVSIQNQLFRSRVYQWLYKLVTFGMIKKDVLKFLGGQEPVERVPATDFKDNIEQAAAICSTEKSVLVLVPRSGSPERRAAMKEIAAKGQAVYVDLDAGSKDDAVLDFANGRHPDAAGYKRIAVLVGRAVDPYIK